MQFLVVLASCLVAASAAPQFITYGVHPSVYSTIVTAPGVSQYHSQDSLGQYSYGYSGGPSTKSETKNLDGVTRGSYSYVDSNNILQSVAYTADSVNGFRASATNLPVAPQAEVAPLVEAPKQVEDLPEVQKARAEHLAVVAKARIAAEASAAEDDEAEVLEAPMQIEDTEEVKQARSEHLALVEEAKKRGASAPQEVIDASAPPSSFSYTTFSHAPYTVLRTVPGPAFAYSVYAPHLITV
ncbi:unnamed protein product [Diamesa serratosioi]